MMMLEGRGVMAVYPYNRMLQRADCPCLEGEGTVTLQPVIPEIA